MNYSLSAGPDYFLCELFNRRTAEETAQFLQAAHRAVVEAQAERVLLCVRTSRALFKVEDYRLHSMIDVAMDLGLKVALSSDSVDIYLSHQYVEMLARQRGLDLRAFPSPKRALEWLLADVAPMTAQELWQQEAQRKH